LELSGKASHGRERRSDRGKAEQAGGFHGEGAGGGPTGEGLKTANVPAGSAFARTRVFASNQMLARESCHELWL
jgi:hypothetical protein